MRQIMFSRTQCYLGRATQRMRLYCASVASTASVDGLAKGFNYNLISDSATELQTINRVETPVFQAFFKVLSGLEAEFLHSIKFTHNELLQRLY